MKANAKTTLTMLHLSFPLHNGFLPWFMVFA
jgi:hypothetical protein